MKKYQVTLKSRAIVHAVVEVEADTVEAAEELAEDKGVELSTSQWAVSDVGSSSHEGLMVAHIHDGSRFVKWSNETVSLEA